MAKPREVEDLYRLSPLQEGMLFASLYQPGSGIYVNQMASTLRGALDAAALERAWRELVARHPIFRTSFHWRELEHPLQVVHRRVELPWRREDWRGRTPGEQAAAFEELLAGERRRGFDLEAAPLMRLALLRLADDAWRLAWSHHHLLLDGWSQPRVLGEVFALYEAFSRGRRPELPTPPPFRAYIEHLQRRDPEADEAFWRRSLAGFTLPTPLPLDRGASRAARDGGERREWGLRLPAPATTALAGLARRRQLTLGSVVHGAWGLLLARHTGEREVLFGTVVSGRPPELAGAEAMVGLFINTLPLRLPVPEEAPAGDWLAGVQKRMLALRPYEHSPLVEVQGWSGVPRGTPLFESLVVFENYPAQPPAGELGGLIVEGFDSREQDEHPLTLAAAPGGELDFRLSWDRRRLEATAARRLLGQLTTLLTGIAAHPDRPLGELPLLSDPERHQLHREWPGGPPGHRQEGTLHGPFEARAATAPHRTAAVAPHDGEALTYGELDARAAALARRLAREGMGPEAVVALLLPRSLELPAALLGVLKSGAAYLPLDPDDPRERLACLLADSGARRVVTREALTGRLPPAAPPVLPLAAGEEDGEEDGSESRTPVPDAGPANLAGRHLAYLIYTSGSTGKPKAVAVPHGAAAAHLAAIPWSYRFGSHDRVHQGASPVFDASVEEIFAPLGCGATLVLAPPGAWSPREMLATVRRAAVTVVEISPAFVHQVLEEASARPPRGPDALQLLSSGGDVLPPAAVEHWRSGPLRRVRLENGYGPTEAVVTATLHRLTPHQPPGRRVPVGRPLPGRQAQVVDRRLRRVPAGAPGELVLGGLLARGYLGRPALTAQAFVPHPWGSAGERLYCTGDRARWLDGGELELLGRTDHQVQVRGFRVELGEVEAALARHPAVAEAAAAVRGGGEAGGGRLVAYLVLQAGAEVTDGELRSHLASWLPGAMIPALFVRLAELPRTAGGKVERRGLPAPEGPDPRRATAPRTATEAEIGTIWEEVLGVSGVGPGDDFFALGGHSLLATRVASRLYERLEVELPLRRLFERSTLEALAREVDEVRAGGAGTALPPLQPQPREGEAPLSFAQQRLWFLEQLEPGGAAYHLPLAVRLEGPLVPRALARALTTVAGRHESLRTAFPARRGEPVQDVAPPRPVPPAVVDLAGLGQEGASRARELAAVEVRRPFRLEEGPLFRCLLIRLAEDRNLLLATFHHMVTDGWSMELFTRELTALYQAAVSGDEANLPPLPVQYADYALWQRRWLAGEALETQLAYWRRRLTPPPPPLELPGDRPRPGDGNPTARTVAAAWPRELTAELEALSRRSGATLFMTLLAAFGALLGRLSGRRDLAVGTPVANRNRLEVEGLIGFFMNTLALRLDLSGQPTFRQLLERVREETLGALAHQELPFEKLVEELAPERHLGRTPLFQVFFNFLEPTAGRVEAAGLTLIPEEVPPPGSKFDLTLYAGVVDGTLQLQLLYAGELFQRRRMEELLGQLQGLCRQAAARPDLPLARLSLVTDEARGRLPDPAAPLPAAPWPGPVTALFRRRAEEGPERVAVVDPEGAWSYGAMAARAGRVARRLAAGGLGRGEVVAVYAHRSAPLVPALLGVLEAGGAFALLDPAHPPRRHLACLEAVRPRGWIELAPAGPPAAELAAFADACPVRLVVGRETPDGEAPAGQALGQEPGPGEAAYVAFTSGSTGAPKAILGEHGPLGRFVAWQGQAFELTAGERVSALSGLGHDPLLRDLFTPLALGATVCIPHPDDLVPHRLAPWMAWQGITVSHLTPALLRILTAGEEVPGRPASRLAGLPALRWVFSGGDRLTRREVEALGRLAPGAGCVNLYGATETPQAVACHRVSPDRFRQGIPLGRGIDEVQLLVVGAGGLPAGVGELGEIQVRTAHLARGYPGSPGLTAERFVPDPGTPGGRRYRTGDLGRYLPGGEVEIAGRLDAQVQIRGVRVEPAEVEAALVAHPGVREAAVVARPTTGDGDGDGELRLVAFAVAAADARPGGDELRRHLARLLPAALLPAAVHFVDSLPLTPNGKVDRRALLQRQTAPPDRPPFRPPEGPLEELLAGLYGRLLEVERVGADESFFALGGHSLLATRLVSRVRAACGVELPVRALFEAPTVRRLAARVASLSRGSLAPPLVRLPRDRPLPLSFAQERLWFLDRMEPGSPVYNLASAARLRGRLEVAVLAAALAEIVRRHESLRTTFAAGTEGPVQVIAPAGACDLPVVDLSGLPAANREPTARRLAGAETTRPFDLTRGPLARMRLLRLAGGSSPGEHLFLVTLHHAVADAWSAGVLVEELSTLYRAFRRGERSPLPELPVQVSDYAVWQRRWLAGGELERQLAYWKGRLAGAPRVLDLPLDRPRPPVATAQGGQHPFHLPAPLAEGVRRQAGAGEATPFMLLLAAFATLLHRLGGDRDLVVGTPIAHRDREEIEGLIGFFVNTLALRLDLGGEPSFRRLLGRVRRTAVEAYAHQDLPFEKLVAELSPARSRSHSPLFQVMFTYQAAPPAPRELPGLVLEPLWVGGTTSKFDLTLVVAEAGEGLSAMLGYRSELFDPTTVRRMAEHLEALLAGIADDPERPLGALPLLSPAAAHQVVREWSRAAAPLAAGEEAVHRQLAAQAGETPDACALADEEERLSYGALLRRVRALARRLRRRGVGADARVALALERSPAGVTALLAVLEAGGAYLPLDPAYPGERLALMLEDARPALVVTGERGLEAPAALSIGERLPPTLSLAESPAEEAGPDRPAAELADGLPDPRQLAYVLYTSGSTGRPKGVAVSHGALARRLRGMQRLFRLGPGHRQLQLASWSFDMSCEELFLPLITGATVLLATGEALRRPREILARCARWAATKVNAPSSVWHQLADEGAGAVEAMPPTLSLLVTGAEAPSPEKLALLTRRLRPPARLLNLYGPTEATIAVTAERLEDAAALAARARLPAGRPLAEAAVYLADPALRPVPAGVAGEVLLAGALARGYLARPAATAAAFLPDPFSHRPGGRLYRTGDRGRLLADGRLELLGRLDHQVKVRGFRLELGEIEEALRRHPQVAEAAVLLRRDVPGGDRLVAYLVTEGGAEPPPVEGLRAFLAGRLPEFMLPALFVPLEELPRTATGKVDRRALPAPDRLRPELAAAYQPPRDPLERFLAELWRQTLGVDRVGRADGFFELGGDSLQGARLINRLEEELGAYVYVTALFDTADLGELASYLRREYPREVERRFGTQAAAGTEPATAAGESQQEAPPPAEPWQPIPAGGWRHGEPLPLSFAQERLWFMEQMEPGESTYHLRSAYRLTGPLEVAAFAAAVGEIVRRHGVLRTRFTTSGGRPAQVVEPAARYRLPVVDVSALPRPAREELSRRRVGRAAREAFDLEAGHLFRLRLLRLAPAEHLLLVNLHHIISDAWSMGVLAEELSALYGAFLAGRPSPLPEPPIQYADFARWQRLWLSGRELERQLAYWRQRLAGTPEVAELPLDRPRPPVVTPQGGRRPFSLDAEATRRLRRLGEAEGATLFMTLLAAFAALLGRATGQQELVVGSPIANRNRREVEGLIGFFVNTLALRVDLGGEPDFPTLLARVRETVLAAFRHQDLPFEKLVAELAPRRSRSHAPLFQVLFTLQPGGGAAAPPLGGLGFEPLPLEVERTKFDLTLGLVETPEGLAGNLGYRSDLFDRTTVARLAGHFRRLLEGLARRPRGRVGAVPLLSPAEAHQLRVEWNDAAAPGETPELFPRRLATRAAGAPHATALVGEEEQVSYAELLARCRRLARRLRQHGVGPEARVGLAAERSPGAVVALLAVLEAGGAYLPLDPAYPDERLRFMLADARPAVLLLGEGLRGRFEGAGLPPLLSLEAEATTGGDPAEEIRPPAGEGEGPAAGSLAYLIYTSGSTGRPKAVAVSHGALARRLRGMQRLFGLGPGHRQLQLTSLSFDVSCEELFVPLAAGASVVLAAGGELRRPREILARCTRERVTKVNAPSSVWHQLADELEAAGEGLPTSISLLVTGAETPSPEKLALLARRTDRPLRLFNLYGPTEATIAVTAEPLPAEPRALGSLPRLPAGRPFPETSVYALDRSLRPLPAGVAGEVFLGGPLARGYLGRPGLTAERFVPDPFSGRAGGRLYRTGDRGRLLADGRLELLGRVDHQVKIRGFRVELGEIEEALRRHPGLQEAAVALREEAPGERRLVAYVVAAGEAPPPVEALRAFLAGELPEYMLPARFVPLDELPRTATGKVDRRALPEPAGLRPELAAAYRPPETPLERFLADLWQETLGVDRVGLGDGFFDLGGDSIKGAVLIRRLEEELGVYVYVTALFDTANLGELAGYLAEEHPEAVEERFGPGALARGGPHPRATPPSEEIRVLGRRELAHLRSLVPPLPPLAEPPPEKNPPAVFVLSPPRSGSTLLRVMLGGHPRLFAPPELELLGFNRLGERRRELSGRYAFWLEGLLRAVMEALGCDADEARRRVAEAEEEDLPVHAFYRRLQGWIDGRTLVDKTPSYALDPAVLARGEAYFRETRYVHLLRHPYASIRSFEEARIDQLFFRAEHPYARRELAELVWTVSHQNVRRFLATVPPERRHTVRFEELTAEPRRVMEELCAFLGVDFHPAMLEPYADKQSRMTDGIHPLAKMLGDVKFHQHAGIDPAVAHRWKEAYDRDFLGPPARELARSLGYRDLAVGGAPAEGKAPFRAPAPSPRRPPRKRPACLVPLRPGGEGRPLFLVHAVTGSVFFLRHLAAALPPERPVYGLQSVGLEGEAEPLDRIEAMAERYLDAVARVQPRGPYHLAGSSMGGLVAYEMARLLAAAGEEAAPVVLLDSPEPDHFGEVQGDDHHARLLEQLAPGAGREAHRRLRRLTAPDERLAFLVEAAQQAGTLPPGLGPDPLRRWLAVVEANARATEAYRPGPFPGRVLLLRAEKTAARRERPRATAWGELAAGGARVELVPGDHLTVHLPPNVAELARQLAAAVAEAVAEAEGAPAGGPDAPVSTHPQP